jgi:hypothetical protein
VVWVANQGIHLSIYCIPIFLSSIQVSSPVSYLNLPNNNPATMCGILGCHRASTDPSSIRAKCVRMSKEQRCRGPDWSGVWVGKDSVLCHERLAIVGVGE